MSRNYYDILGVDESASTDDIKKAFRTLAKKHHPDRNKGDAQAEVRFKELSEAYDTLADEQKKSQYDMMRKYGAQGGFGGARGVDPGSFGNADFSQFFGRGGPHGGSFTFHAGGSGGVDNLDDIISSLFGGRDPFAEVRRPGIQKGSDIHATIRISFMDAINGCAKTISGKQTSRKIRVRIPRGICDGGQIRLTGQGQPGLYGGRNGDLIIKVQVMPDKLFERKGNDVYTKVKVSFKDAILGAKVMVDTLSKKVSLTVPPGTQPGAKMRLKGQGLSIGNTQGDQYVTIEIEIPRSITQQQRKLLEKWNE